MATYFNDIEAALMSRLNTLADSPPIAWPNVEYKPSASTAYLRANFLPSDTLQVSLGANGKDETIGIFQVDAVIPAGSGRTTLPDSIADHFSRGSTVSYNGVNVRIRSVSVGPAISEGAWYFVPVSINFQTYTEAR